MGNACACCWPPQPPGGYLVVPDVREAIAGMEASTQSFFKRYGRAAYKFEPPEDPEPPEFAVSHYKENDPLEAGNAIIDHYIEARETCQIIGQALIDCMRDLELELHKTELSACIQTLRRNKHITINIVDPKTSQDAPHVLPHSDLPLPEKINSACHNLNTALDRSFKFKNEHKHTETHNHLDEVFKYRRKGKYMQKSFERLKMMVSFIDDLKSQCEYFIHDFLSV